MQYASELANKYSDLSDKASSAEDAAALALIASAGVAAGGLLYDASIDLIKGAGLAAGAITATSAYFKPQETGTFLLDAAEQLLCIVKAGRDLPIDPNDGEAMNIVDDGILTVRINLRKNLRRTLPDYRQLVKDLQGLATAPLPRKLTGAVDVHAEVMRRLRLAVAACVLPR
jgi:hypothetical protein